MSIASACRARSRRAAIIDIGAERERVTVTGSLKFDSLEIPGVAEPATAAGTACCATSASPRSPGRHRREHAQGRRGAGPRGVPAHLARRTADALLIIAPRKPERFDEVERLARRAGWNVARRSELRVDAEPRHDVVVLDTIGELAQLFQVATVVFVGGSLVDAGGHNILEPAVFGKPIVFGPHMQNFAEIAQTFLDNGAAIQVRDRPRARAGAARRCSAIRSGAPASARPRARSSKPTAAPAARASPSSRSSCRPTGTSGNVRPFTGGHVRASAKCDSEVRRAMTAERLDR